MDTLRKIDCQVTTQVPTNGLAHQIVAGPSALQGLISLEAPDQQAMLVGFQFVVN
jgi:hypothetical protein